MLDALAITCYKISMNNNERLADQFTNVAMMFSFQEVDKKLIAAFDTDNHAMVVHCGDLYNALIDDVCKFIPAANA